MKRWIRIFAWVFLFAAVAGTSGCNTFRGMGEDFKAAGRAIQNAVSPER